MAVAGMGVMVALAFGVTRLPEVSEAELQATAVALADEANANSKLDKPFYKQYRAIFGFVAQFVSILLLKYDMHVLTSCCADVCRSASYNWYVHFHSLGLSEY